LHDLCQDSSKQPLAQRSRFRVDPSFLQVGAGHASCPHLPIPPQSYRGGARRNLTGGTPFSNWPAPAAFGVSRAGRIRRFAGARPLRRSARPTTDLPGPGRDVRSGTASPRSRLGEAPEPGRGRHPPPREHLRLTSEVPLWIMHSIAADRLCRRGTNEGV
jgi:hypothetical protein